MIYFDTSGAINPATDPFGRSIGYLNTRGGISRGFETERRAGAHAVAEGDHRLHLRQRHRAHAGGGRCARNLRDSPEPVFHPGDRAATSRLLLTCDTLASSNYLAPVYADFVSSFVTQTYRFGGIHKVNLGASYRIPFKEYQAIRLFVRAENIFNQTYFESGFLTAGRTANAGLQFEF